MIKYFITLSILTYSVNANSNCCPGENLLGIGKCVDGSEILLRNDCAYRFLIDPNVEGDDFTILENGSLMYFGTKETLDPDLYCIGKRNESIKPVALVCVLEDALSNEKWLVVRAGLGFLSVIFLVLTITVYFLVPRLRDLQGKCILHSLIGLTLSYFTLSIIQILTDISEVMCVFMAFTIYITFLLAFFWLNIVAFNVWRATVIPNLIKKADNRWHILYCIYGYGLPLIFLVAVLITHHIEGNHIKPGFGSGSCFFKGPGPTWAYFYGPIAAILSINSILFIWSSIKLWFDSSQQNTPKLRNLKYKFLLTIKLFFIMGLLWIFEVLSYVGDDVYELKYLWVITDYVNIVQGVLIFLILVVFRKKALRGLARNRFFGTKFPRSWTSLQDEECSDEEGSKEINNAT